MDPTTLNLDRIWSSELMDHPLVGTHQRRLSDKILIVFHHACDSRDFVAAEGLLTLLETLTTRGPCPETGNRRLNVDSLVCAFDRLWRMKNPGCD